MILSAGLTPAWQQIMLFPSLRWGEVNRASQVLWRAQGKVINVGVAAHTLGGPSLTLAPLGGPAQQPIDDQLAALGVPRRWITTESPTRVCTTVLDQTTGASTELIENGRPLLPRELDAFCHAYAEEAARADVVVLTGSLPDGAPVAFYRELVAKTPCPAVLDFRGEGLLQTLDLRPYVVKPNREELAATVGRPLETDAELLAAMRSLNDRGAEWVVVTQGPGPVWATSAKETFRFMPPRCDCVKNVNPSQNQPRYQNPLGCGDALAAAIAWAIRDRRSMFDAIRFGIAAAVENLGQLEVCRLDKSLVEHRVSQVSMSE